MSFTNNELGYSLLLFLWSHTELIRGQNKIHKDTARKSLGHTGPLVGVHGCTLVHSKSSVQRRIK